MTCCSLTNLLAMLGDYAAKCPWTFFALKIVGAIWCLLLVFKVLSVVWRYLLRGSYDLLQRYGSKGCWALVTGATDGIGLAYAKELAMRGFNIMMVARNAQKLEKRKAEVLEAGRGKVEVKTVVQDFNVSFSERNYAQLIAEIKDRDIAILVNNVGVMNVSDFHQFPQDKLLEILNVNMEATTFVTRLVIPGMLKRGNRCGVVTISSSLGDEAYPYCGVYSATKAYGIYLSNSLALEYKGTNLDFLVCHTGAVTTHSNPNSGLVYITAEEAARSHLRFLGKDRETYGTLRHYMFSLVGSCGWMRRKIGAGLKEFFSHQKTE